MNVRRLALAAVVTWVVYLGLSYLVHAVLLKGIYLQHAASMRPEVEASAILPIGFAFALVGFVAFVYAYATTEASGVGSGVRFGLLTGVVLCCFGSIWDYMVWPVSPTLAALWILDFMAEFALYGAIVGALYQPSRAPARVAMSV